MKNYRDYFPLPVLEDLVNDRWVPIIGAGFSKNAVVPNGKAMPKWDELGAQIGKRIPGYHFDKNPLDALSAYAHEFGRLKLIEQVEEALMVDLVKPGIAHTAFAKLPFELVCTTNFEFLIEQAYQSLGRYCRPLVGETQLALSGVRRGYLAVNSSELMKRPVDLLKIHGDLNHPENMVVTEQDFDGFLSRFPILSTFVANLLINRAPVLIGYSLDDPDLRHLWAIIRDRLGVLTRPAYSLNVDPSPDDIARYARRGIRVIPLPSEGRTRAEVFRDTFEWLTQYWMDHLIVTSTSSDEESKAELSLPRGSTNRLCFFAVPSRWLSFYRQNIFPIVEKYGFVPALTTDIHSPTDNVVATVSALLERAEIIVSDILSMEDVQIALSIPEKIVLLISEEGIVLPRHLHDLECIFRPYEPSDDPTQFLASLEFWFSERAKRLKPSLEAEPQRLLDKGEYNSAVICAISLLEIRLRQSLRDETSQKQFSVRGLLGRKEMQQWLEPAVIRSLTRWAELRNRLLHSGDITDQLTAKRAVNDILIAIEKLPPFEAYKDSENQESEISNA